MGEELTTLMHSEFFDDPEEHRDILIMGAFCRIERGEPKLEVLKEYGLSEREYDENVKRVLPYSST